MYSYIIYMVGVANVRVPINGLVRIESVYNLEGASPSELKLIYKYMHLQ